MTSMNNAQLNDTELDMANGGSFWSYRPNNGKTQKSDKNLVLPGMDVDNRPPIDITLHRPTLPQE